MLPRATFVNLLRLIQLQLFQMQVLFFMITDLLWYCYQLSRSESLTFEDTTDIFIYVNRIGCVNPYIELKTWKSRINHRS
jgi:hypothetical protein